MEGDRHLKQICKSSDPSSSLVLISYPAGHDISSYCPVTLLTTHFPTMLLLSEQLKSAFRKAHSPSPHRAPLGHV